MECSIAYGEYNEMRPCHNFIIKKTSNLLRRNKPTQLLDSAVCGNGFVEPGEECDCGLPILCTNPCCNAHTCKLRPGASCATGECCDLRTCAVRYAGTVCRPRDNECDLPELCNGESEYCPPDYFKRNTEFCDRKNAYCYEGACRSHNDQCKLVWGPTGRSVDECYDYNVEGEHFGNCGYDRLNGTLAYKRCSSDDIMCGQLHCKSSKEIPEFGDIYSNFSQCQQIVADVGLHSSNHGLAPNGAKCGEGKMCHRHKCLSVERLRAVGMGVDCPENCNGHGICNNKGHCHCDDGYVAPFCNLLNDGNGPEINGPEFDVTEVNGPEINGPEIDGSDFNGPAASLNGMLDWIM